MTREKRDIARGGAMALAAYAIWGLFPIYWKWLQDVSALQLVAHRILWTSLILGMVIAWAGQWRMFAASVRSPGIIRVYLAAAVLMGINWWVFVLAVNSGNVTQTGLGYFISPLVNIVMGVVLFNERLRPWQWVSAGLAGAGVLYLTLAQGKLPWMALALAFSFGTYGLVKKVAALGAVHGLMLETAILLPAAVPYLAYCEMSGQGAFLHAGPMPTLLMAASGLVSMAPLLLFAHAAQRIPLTHLGLLQYVTPGMQLLLGVMLYHEPFGGHSLIGFGLVWIALLLFIGEGVVSARNPGDSRQ